MLFKADWEQGPSLFKMGFREFFQKREEKKHQELKERSEKAKEDIKRLKEQQKYQKIIQQRDKLKAKVKGKNKGIGDIIGGEKLGINLFDDPVKNSKKKEKSMFDF